MFEKLEQLDRELFLYLNGLHTDWLDPVMWYISSIILWIPLFLFFLYYAYRKGGIKLALVITGGIALCILLADRISVLGFKEVFERFRPTHNLEIKDLVHTVIKPNGEEYRGGIYSFVSSHATNFMALGTFLFARFRSYSNWWWLLFPWVALVAYSRIYLGVHYPADLIGGALLGALIGYVVYRISLKIEPIKKT